MPALPSTIVAPPFHGGLSFCRDTGASGSSTTVRTGTSTSDGDGAAAAAEVVPSTRPLPSAGILIACTGDVASRRASITSAAARSSALE